MITTHDSRVSYGKKSLKKLQWIYRKKEKNIFFISTLKIYSEIDSKQKRKKTKKLIKCDFSINKLKWIVFNTNRFTCSENITKCTNRRNEM